LILPDFRALIYSEKLSNRLDSVPYKKWNKVAMQSKMLREIKRYAAIDSFN
jgi:hypothetical protein